MRSGKILKSCKVLSKCAFMFVVAFVFFAPREAHAIAAFARKYNVDCNMCHTLEPQLNKTGYIFRANGYRMPEENPEEEEFNIGNSISVRGFFQWQNTNQPGSTTDPINDAKNGFRLKEVQLFAAGPIPKSPLSYFGEFVLNEDGKEGAMVENYFLRYTKPSGNNLLFAKMGQFHAIEGYMGVDRPLVLDRTFVLNKKVLSKRAWHDERGITLGYVTGLDVSKPTTSLALSLLNGLDETGSGVPEDSQNRNQAYDLQFIGTHFFDARNALSLYYYSGKNAQDTDGVVTTSEYENSYNRWGLFGNFYAMDNLNLQAGYLTRKEESSATTSFGAKGWYGQLDYEFKPSLFGSLRYDKWDPSDTVASNELTGWLVEISQHFTNGARATLQYTSEKNDAKKGTAGETTNVLTAELQVMW